jgi:hypothetical protein
MTAKPLEPAATADDLEAWLSSRKQGWRVIRQAKRRDKALRSSSAATQVRGRRPWHGVTAPPHTDSSSFCASSPHSHACAHSAAP